jgi:uncharacterized membrane protein
MSVRSSTPDEPLHPALAAHARQRAQSLQNRIADAITRFAGSMAFVYVHLVWFGLWIGLRVEKFPFGLLTMIVSLEAIFLSTFLLISQNRQDEARQHLATMEWQLVEKGAKENELEIQQNEQLLELSNQILALTRAVHELTIASKGDGSSDVAPAT